MHEVKAIIRPFMLDKVLDSLRQIEDMPSIAVSEVKVFPRTQRAAETGEPAAQHLKMTKSEIVVSDALLERVVRTIQEHAHTGNPLDGKIFVYQVNDVIRIRTGERGEAAILSGFGIHTRITTRHSVVRIDKHTNAQTRSKSVA